MTQAMIKISPLSGQKSGEVFMMLYIFYDERDFYPRLNSSRLVDDSTFTREQQLFCSKNAIWQMNAEYAKMLIEMECTEEKKFVEKVFTN